MTYHQLDFPVIDSEPTRILSSLDGNTWVERRAQIVAYTASGLRLNSASFDVRVALRESDNFVGIWKDYAGIGIGVGSQQFSRYRSAGIETRLTKEQRPKDGNRTYHDLDRVLMIGWAKHHGGPFDKQTVQAVLSHISGETPLDWNAPDSNPVRNCKMRKELPGQTELDLALSPETSQLRRAEGAANALALAVVNPMEPR